MTAAGLNRLEDDNRNHTDPLELLLVFGKPVPVGFLLLEDAVALVALRHAGAHRKAIGADLDFGVRVRHKVVIPIRVLRIAALRGKHGDGVVVELLVGERVHTLDASLCSAVVKQQESPALEGAADAPSVGAELVDDCLVPVTHAVCNAGRPRLLPSTA